MNLMIYADFFMLDRLSEICQQNIAKFLKPQNALEIYLVAEGHNAEQLKLMCLHFLAVNQPE